MTSSQPSFSSSHSAPLPEGNAVVYCDRAFQTTNGKTAHGLVRFTRRYRVASVIDSSCRGRDAGEVLDGQANGIPIVADLDSAISDAAQRGISATHFVVGIAPDGGRITPDIRESITAAIQQGLNVDSGLHDFISEDSSLARAAAAKGVVLRDVRKPPPREELRFFAGKIEQVGSRKVAVLGVDSAVGKRTTAWKLVDAFMKTGRSAEMIGTGQTAWMQGARYGIILDALVSDFIAGELEHAAWSAWNEQHTDVIVVEGQGSLMNPAYPGGLEILAAVRPDVVVLQHAPTRKEYDGFPGYPLHPLDHQIQAIEVLSGRPVVAITVNHEGILPEQTDAVCRSIEQQAGLPTFDVLRQGAAGLADVVWSAAERIAKSKPAE